MSDSILVTIKKMLGIASDVDHFDQDIIVYINSTFMLLNQLGIGASEGFIITGDTETWTTFIGARIDLEAVKTYTYLRVKLLFDPPTSATVIESMERFLTQLEYRINTQVEIV